MVYLLNMVDRSMAMLNYQMVHLFFLELDGVVNIEKWIQNSCGASWCVSTLSILSTFKSQIWLNTVQWELLLGKSYGMGFWLNRDCHSSPGWCCQVAQCLLQIAAGFLIKPRQILQTWPSMTGPWLAARKIRYVSIQVVRPPLENAKLGFT